MNIENNIINETAKMNEGVEANLNSLFVRIPNNYVVVATNLRGKMRIVKPGLKIFWPFEKKKLYYIGETPIDYKEEPFRSKEGFEVIVDSAVTYKVFAPIKFHQERNAAKQLNIAVEMILRRLVASMSYDEISNVRLDIKPSGNFPWIADELKELERKYGISVTDITIQKVELTDDLKKVKEDDALNDAENARLISKASAELEAAKLRAAADLEIARVKAETIKLEKEAEAVSISKKIEEISKQIGGANTAEKLKLIRDIITREQANYTVIENNNLDESYSKLLVATNVINNKNNKRK